VDPKARRRLAIAHRVLDAVRTAEFRSDTLANRNGEHVIMPALPDDTMEPLFEQLHQTEGPLHIATLHGEDLTVFAMMPIAPPTRPRRPGRHAHHLDDDLRISSDMSVGVVVDYLFLRDSPVVFREASPQVCLELVERPDVSDHQSSPCGAGRRTRPS
jgi:hypothetical protein